MRVLRSGSLGWTERTAWVYCGSGEHHYRQGQRSGQIFLSIRQGI